MFDNNFEIKKLFQSNNCYLDQVLVYMNRRNAPYRLCGQGTFSRDSDSNEVQLYFQSVFDTPGGRFFCTAQAINTNDNNCRCGWKKPVR